MTHVSIQPTFFCKKVGQQMFFPLKKLVAKKLQRQVRCTTEQPPACPEPFASSCWGRCQRRLGDEMGFWLVAFLKAPNELVGYTP